jgi:hypothetical protein
MTGRVHELLRHPTENRIGMRSAWQAARRDGLSPRELAEIAGRLRHIEPRRGVESRFRLNKVERREVAEELLRSGDVRRTDHLLLGMARSTWNDIARELAPKNGNGGDKPHSHAGSENGYASKASLPCPRPYSREKGYSKFSFSADSGDWPCTLDEALEIAWQECQDQPAYWNLGLSDEQLREHDLNARTTVGKVTLSDLLDCLKRHGRTDGDQHCILQTGREVLTLRDYRLLEQAWRRTPKADRSKVRRRG